MQKIRSFLALALLGFGSAAAAPFAYVPDARQQINVIDLATNTVVTKISGEFTPGGVAASRTDNRVYISDWATNTVQVIDTSTNSTIRTLDVCPTPYVIALNPAGTKLLVPCKGLLLPSLFSMVIDTATFEPTLVPAFGGWTAAWDGAGTKFYIGTSSSILVYDAATLQQSARVRVPDGAFGMAVNAAGTRLYVTSSRSANGEFGENVLTIYETNGYTEIKRVPLASESGWIALDPSGTRLYVPLIGADALAVFDAAGNPLTTVAFPQNSRPQSVAVHPDGSRVYVQVFNPGQLVVLQAPGYATLATVSYGPFGVAQGSFIGNGSATVAANAPGFLTGLWWNPGQSGWGIGITRRGLNLFAAWFTYDLQGKPTWHVSTCKMFTPYNCNGSLLQLRGVRFDFSGPYDARFAEVVETGSLELSFRDSNHGRLEYAVGDVNSAVDIERQPIATQGPVPAVNYTDLWWNAGQSGWGIHITHQRNAMFLAWFVYNEAFLPMWYVMNCTTNAAGNACSGPLYRTTGPNFDPAFDPARVRVIPAGSMTVTFSGPNDGVLTYTVDGVSGTKTITRQVF